MPAETIFTAVDLIGVFVGALTGALVARRFRYDVAGHWGLALVSGLGGGMIRDVLIQDGAPRALVDPLYLPTVLVAAACSVFFGRRVDQLKGPILVADAIALGDFAVAGCLRSIDAGLGVWPVVLLGVITAVGGGVIRDMLTGQPPVIFQESTLYATAALAASIAVVVTHALGAPRPLTFVVGLGVGVLLRLGSVRYNWRLWVPR
ncbi:MAG TPA: TRIC cation channel family protein [Thermomicrobiales bacterium]|nr:TRIC cation channel family protein [Thermomicrobiales bacterium]